MERPHCPGAYMEKGIWIHPGQMVTVDVGGERVVKRDAEGNVVFTCCGRSKR